MWLGSSVAGTDTGLVVATIALAATTLLVAGAATWSAQVTARGFQRSLLPILVPARPDGLARVARFGSERHTTIVNADIYAVVENDRVFLGVAMSNIGSGIAVLHGVAGERLADTAGLTPAAPPGLHGLMRAKVALYAAPQDPAVLALWHPNINGLPQEDIYVVAHDAITEHDKFALDLVYTDHTNRQMTISRIELYWANDVGRYVARTIGHWRRRGVNRWWINRTLRAS